MMTDGTHSKVQMSRTELPGWIRTFMALAGGILLLGPTLAVVWPH